MKGIKKVDLRFNDVKEAIIEIKRVLSECPLTNDAIAILIANTPKSGISKTQALAVLDGMAKLEKHYIKKDLT